MKTTTMLSLSYFTLGAVLLLSAAACKSEPPTVTERVQAVAEEADDQLSHRLDDLEEDWIRLEAKAEGKSELGAEIEVMKDDVKDTLQSAKDQMSRMGSASEDEAADMKRALKEKIDAAEAKLGKLADALG